MNFNALGLEKIPKPLNLLLEFPYKFRIRVLVDDRLADDGFGAIRITQGGQRLIVINISWANGGYHGGLAVPAQVFS